MRRVRLLVLQSLLVLPALSTTATARVIHAPTGSSSDVQAACNQAASGDTVRIPAGTYTFTSTVVCNSGISIMGSGQSRTTLQFSNPSQYAAMIRINNDNNLPTEICDLTLIGAGFDGSVLDKGIHLSSGCRDFRIHHVTFRKFGDSGIWVGGNARGVVDHCTFTDIRYGNVDSMGYGVCVVGDGAASWSRPLGLGSEEAVFIEDCGFTGCRHAVASNEGSRYVFRYNEVRNPPGNWVPIDAHGREYGSSSGSRSWEIYGNTVLDNTGEAAWCGTALRGGDGVVFDNTYGPGINHPVYLCNRLDDSHTTCSYPCPDQTRELHAWNNTNNGSPVYITVRTGHEVFFQEGRDYFNYARPGYVPYTYPHPLTGGGASTPLTISTETLPDGVAGAAYSASLSADGGLPPCTWSLQGGGLPDGLSLLASGSISGTPSTPGAATVTVRVTDSEEATAEKELTLTVLGPEDQNVANGATHIANSGNFASGNPVASLWDGDLSGSSEGSPGNSGQDSFWVEFDLGVPYVLSLIRLMGDAEGTWVSNTYTVQTRTDPSAGYTTIIDNQACSGNQWYVTEVSIETRFVRLSVVGDTIAHAVQAREFEVYGRPVSTTATKPATEDRSSGIVVSGKGEAVRNHSSTMANVQHTVYTPHGRLVRTHEHQAQGRTGAGVYLVRLNGGSRHSACRYLAVTAP